MKQTRYVLTGTLSADVADTGTFTVSYPARGLPEQGTLLNSGEFYLSMGHKIIVAGGNEMPFPDKMNLAFGTSTITVTNRSGSTWLSGSSYRLELVAQGNPEYRAAAAAGTGKAVNRMARSGGFLINLGNPVVGAATAVCAAQAIGGAVNANINGTAASGGAYVADVPRAVNVVSAGAGDTTQTVTITGLDEYGNTMREAIALNGTSTVAGKKAFAKVTQVAVSASMAGNLSVGTTNVLGLPVFLPSAGNIVKELQDGATATAGTTVAGIRTAGGSTSTTGDVRGTYAPNATPDGSKTFQLIVSLPDPQYLGISQF